MSRRRPNPDAVDPTQQQETVSETEFQEGLPSADDLDSNQAEHDASVSTDPDPAAATEPDPEPISTQESTEPDAETVTEPESEPDVETISEEEAVKLPIRCTSCGVWNTHFGVCACGAQLSLQDHAQAT